MAEPGKCNEVQVREWASKGITPWCNVENIYPQYKVVFKEDENQRRFIDVDATRWPTNEDLLAHFAARSRTEDKEIAREAAYWSWVTKITRGYIWDTAANPLKPSASGVFGSGMSWQYRARHHVPKDDEHMVRNAIIKGVFSFDEDLSKFSLSVITEKEKKNPDCNIFPRNFQYKGPTLEPDVADAVRVVRDHRLQEENLSQRMGAARSTVGARAASADNPSAGEGDAAGHRRPQTDSPPPTSRRRTDYRPGQSSGSGLRLRGRQEVADEERAAGRPEDRSRSDRETGGRGDGRGGRGGRGGQPHRDDHDRSGGRGSGYRRYRDDAGGSYTIDEARHYRRRRG